MRARNPHGYPDANQPLIVEVLRRNGALVQITTGVGAGFPDLVVGFRGRVTLLEVKSPGGELNDLEVRWHSVWRHLPVHVVKTPEEALRAIGALRE